MFTNDSRGTVFEVTVKPRSGRCRIIEASTDRVRVDVTAPPEGGKATEQTLRTLADALDIPASRVLLLKGRTSRHKTVLASGLSVEDCITRLAAAAT